MEFWNELLTYEGEYGRQMLLAFYYYWAEQVTGRRRMRLELETSWDTGYRLAAWSKRRFAKNDEAAAIRLERVKNKTAKPTVNTENTAEQRALAAEREAANARREQELAEAKAGAVSYEEYIRQKNEKKS